MWTVGVSSPIGDSYCQSQADIGFPVFYAIDDRRTPSLSVAVEEDV